MIFILGKSNTPNSFGDPMSYSKVVWDLSKFWGKKMNGPPNRECYI